MRVPLNFSSRDGVRLRSRGDEQRKEDSGAEREMGRVEKRQRAKVESRGGRREGRRGTEAKVSPL